MSDKRGCANENCYSAHRCVRFLENYKYKTISYLAPDGVICHYYIDVRKDYEARGLDAPEGFDR